MAKSNLWIALLIFAYIWLPTGDPTDVVTTPYLISTLGPSNYAVLSFLIVFFVWHAIDGKTAKSKLKNVSKEVRKVLK